MSNSSASLSRKANTAWQAQETALRSSCESGGAYVRSIEFVGLRAKVCTMHPDRAAEGMRGAGFADWCAIEIAGCDRVDVVCMDPTRIMGVQHG